MGRLVFSLIGLEPERRVPARATLSTAAGGGCREKGLAQRSAIDKATLLPQSEPGTARGVAKQLRVPPSPPKQKSCLKPGRIFALYCSFLDFQ
jgi:hypothetical protein